MAAGAISNTPTLIPGPKIPGTVAIPVALRALLGHPFNIPSTSYKCTLQRDLFDAYVAAHDEPLRERARDVVSKINHISFRQFYDRLKESVKDLEKKLSGDKKFVILIGSQPDATCLNKSNLWVTRLALRCLKKTPDAILLSDDPIAQVFVQRNPSEIVFFDDAIYSGEQMKTVIDQFFMKCRSSRASETPVHVCVPFATRKGKEMVEKPTGLFFEEEDPVHPRSVSLGSHEVLPSIDELGLADLPVIAQMIERCKKAQEAATKASLAHFKKLLPGFDFESPVCKPMIDLYMERDRVRTETMTLTSFDHKTPDMYSTAFVILKGKKISGEEAPVGPLVKELDPPYKLPISLSLRGSGSGE